MLLRGRQKIYTDEKEITRDNIIPVLRKAYSQHRWNQTEIQFLIDYERGVQPLKREKTKRPDIDIQVCDNIAHYIKHFNIGYFWSNPIMLVQRGNKEIHKTDSDVDSDGIAALNEMLKNAENISYKDQCLGEFLEIAGIGHRFIDVKTDFEDDTLFWNEDKKFTGSLVNIYTLDSRYAFCVYHNGIGQKKLMGVTFGKGERGKLNFTCFTDKERFEISDWKIQGEVTTNPLGKVPVIEYERSVDRTGCFERNISEMDSLNVLISDFTNDVAQRTQEIWWGNDFEFAVDEKTGEPKAPKSGQWVMTYSGEGKNPKIQPLSSVFDSQSTLSSIDKQRSWILQKCNVPIQYDSSGGGSTGVAMDMAAGWSDAEVAAMQKQQMIERGKREEIALILKAISLVPQNILPYDSPIRKVHVTDVEFKYTRRNDYDLISQMNAFGTGISHGIHPRHLFPLIKALPDSEQVYIDSKDTLTAYMKSAFGIQEESNTVQPEGRLDQDLSDQVQNSPLLGGRDIMA